jgi:outer membrane protein TolC
MADIGVSEAALYPQIRLTARWGQTSVDPGDLFSYSASGWTVAPQVHLPLVGRAALKAEIRRTVAEARRADARYRSVVVRAFSEAADALAALESADAEIALQAEAVRLSEEALSLERRSYQLGAGRLPDVISAQRQASLARLSAVRAEAQRVRAIIRLSAAFAFAPDALTLAP